MSNKQQLQTNNTKYASLIETLRGKAIPSGNEDLDTELTEQENLISQLSTILDSKASGGSGGSVETCTVTINSSELIEYVCATTLSNEKIGGYYFNSRGSEDLNTVTLENVVCGSFIGLYSEVRLPVFAIVNGGETIDYGTGFITIKAPLEADVHCTISISDNS